MGRKTTTTTTTTTTVAANTAEGMATAPVKEEHAITAPMRAAIIGAHKIGNPHAITQAEATGYSNVPLADFNKWLFYISELRTVAIKYGEIAADKDADPKELELAKGRVFQKWKSVLKVGNENLLHPNMFCREHDADTLRVYATGITWVAPSEVGSCFCHTDPGRFRRMVELFLGCRIAANKLLCDDDRDAILGFQAAKKSKEKAQERLDGSPKDGKNVIGLTQKLEDQKGRLADAERLLIDTVGEETAKSIIETNPSFVEMRATIRTTEGEISKCNKAIFDADAYISEHSKRYNQIIATLKRVEAPAMV